LFGFDFISVLCTVAVFVIVKMDVLDDDYCELEASARHGNASRAASIAKKLAEKKVPISIRISDLQHDVPEIPVKYETLLRTL